MKEDRDILGVELARFSCPCNLQLRVVESICFKNAIYKKCIEESRFGIKEQSALTVNG